MTIIKYRVYAYILSLALVLGSVVAWWAWGLKLNIDFTGGTLMEVSFTKETPSADVVRGILTSVDGLSSVSVQQTENNRYLIRFVGDGDVANEKVLTALKAHDTELTVLRTDYIGSSISSQLKEQAITAIILSIIGIMVYVAWAFKGVSVPVSSFYYGLGAIIALAHDIIITVGVFAVLGHFYGIEVGIPFIAALLTILGYSVNDTIVVYDRTRENLLRAKSHFHFPETVDLSLRQTLGRSFNTSFTVMIVLVSVAYFADIAVRDFAIALFIGVTVGTYSSIFIASSLLVTFYLWKKR